MAVTAALPAAAPRLRSGLLDWLRSCAVMARWELASLRLYIPVLMAVEILSGAGLVLGFGLFFSGPVPAESVLYLSTGVPVITLYIVGMVFLPQVVSQQRIAHTYDYVQSMATPRSARFVAWYLMNLLGGVPGMVAAMLAAHLRYGAGLHLSPTVVPAVLLVILTSTALGFAMGHAIPLPMLVNIVTQVLNFFVIGFSPVDFPPGQLPGWLLSFNQGLPFQSMGTVMRAAIGGSPVSGLGAAYLLLLGWSAVCLLLAAVSVMRRA